MEYNGNYTKEELKNLLGSVGNSVHIHRSVVFFNPKMISIASDVRIDCFAILSAGEKGIQIGNHVHIAAATHLFGSGGQIIIEDFSNISSRVSLFTASDDYKEGFLTNPTIPTTYKKVFQGNIFLSSHAIVGCGSVILPNVNLGIGASVGALSLVKKDVDPFTIVAGIPAKIVGLRSKDLLIHEQSFLATKQ